MKVNEQIEPLVREALDAAVKRDGDRLDRALDAFTDSAQQRGALELLGAIGSYVLLDLYQGQRPSDQQVGDLADQIAEMEAWTTLPAEEIRAFLLVLLGDATTVDPAAAVLLPFVVTAALLSSRRRPEGQWWFNYLDQVEAAIEAVP